MTLAEYVPEELVTLAWVLGATDAEGNPSDAFLADPVAALRGVLTEQERREAAFELLGDLLAAAGVDAPDLPETDGDDWSPVWTHESGTGAIGVLHHLDDEGVLHVALGIRVDLDPDGSDVTVSIRGRIPILRVDTTGTELGVDAPAEGDGLAIGLEVGLDASSLVASIDGVAVSLLLPYDGSEPDLKVVLRGVRLGTAPPMDLTPDDLVDRLGSTGTRMAVALLRSRSGGSPELAALLALLGLDAGHASIPPLPVDDLIDRGLDALVDWLRGTVADAAAVRGWLQELATLLGVDATIEGGGSTADPYRLCAGSDPADDPAWQICATLAVASDPVTGQPTLVPGLRATLASVGTPQAALVARVDLATLTLGPSPTAVPLPVATVTGRLGDDDGTTALLDDQVDLGGTPTDVRIGWATVGLGVTAGQFLPTLALHDVTVGTDHHDVVDLTSVDAVADVGGGMLERAVDQLVDALTGGVDTAVGRSLAALAGLVEPAGAPADWPDLVGLGGLFADPLIAIGRYHARVLDAPPAGDGNRWRLLAAEVGRLVTATTGAAAPEVTGAGTATDPWLIPLADEDLGRVALTLWAVPAAGLPERAPGRGAILHLATVVESRRDVVDGTDLDLRWQLEALRIDLPTGGGDAVGGVELDLATGLDLELALGPDLATTVAGATLRADRLGVRVSWSGGELQADPILDGVRVEAGVGGVDLEDVLDGLAHWADRFDLDEFPTDTLEHDLLRPLLAWLATVLDGVDAGERRFAEALTTAARATRRDLTALVDRVTGAGTHADPWRLAVRGAGLDLTGWLDPDGPTRDTAQWVGTRATGLVDDLAGAADDLGAGVLEEALALAARVDGPLRDVLADRAVGDVLDGVATVLAGTDGVLDTADQQAPGWATSQLASSHLAAPGAFVPDDHLASGDASPERHLYVAVAAAGLAPWAALAGLAPTEAARRHLDLRAVNLDPASIDVSAIDGPGPWFVTLPDRTDAAVVPSADFPTGPAVDGFDGQVGRLDRAVAALAAHVGDVVVIAHGTATHAAREVAAGGDVATVVAVAAPLTDPGGLVAAEAHDTIRLLAGLLDLAGVGVGAPDGGGVPAALTPVAELVADAAHVLDGWTTDADEGVRLLAVEVADHAPPPLASLPAAVDRLAVVVRRERAELVQAVHALVRRVVQRTAADAPDGRAATHLGLGLGLPPTTTTGPDGLSATFAARLDLASIRLRDEGTARPTPTLVASLALGRVDGWLVGGPGTGPRTPGDPRVRRLDVELHVPLGGAAPTRLRLVAHEAGVLGRAWTRLVIDDPGDLTLDGLVPDDPATHDLLSGPARDLLQAVADALWPDPPPDATPWGDVLTLLRGLGLVHPRPAGDPRGPGLELPVDVVEQWLVDAGRHVGARLAGSAPERAAVLDALRALLGAGGTGDRIVVTPGGSDGPVEVVVDVGSIDLAHPDAGPTTVRIRTVGDGVPLGPVGLVGGMHLEVGPTVTVSTAVAATTSALGPLGRPSVVLATATGQAPSVTLATHGATVDPLGGPLPVWPPDPAVASWPATVLSNLAGLLPGAAIAAGLAGPTADTPELQAIVARLVPQDLAVSSAELATPGGAFRALVSLLVPLVLDPAATLVEALGATIPRPDHAPTDDLLGVLALASDPAAIRARVVAVEVRARAGLPAGASPSDLTPALVATAASAPVLGGSLVGEGGRTAARAARGRVALAPGVVAGLLDAVGALLDAGHAPGDPLELPFGLQVAATSGGEGLAATWQLPGADEVTPAATLGITVGPGLDLGCTFGASVEVVTPAGRVAPAFGIDDTGVVTADVTVDLAATDEVRVTLLPEVSGLDRLAVALAGEAVTTLLPLLLDEVGDVPTLGAVLDAVGTALGLRDSAGWDGAALAAVAPPSSDVVGRLTDATTIGTALGALLELVLDDTEVAVTGPAGDEVVTATIWSDGTGGTLTVEITQAPLVCLQATAVPVVPGEASGDPARVLGTAEICLGSAGPSGIALRVEVADPDWLDAGPVTLLPEVAVLWGTAADGGPSRVEAGAWLSGGPERTGVFAVVTTDGAVTGEVFAADRTSTGGTVVDQLGALARTALVPLALELALEQLDELLVTGWNAASLRDHLIAAEWLTSGGALQPDITAPELLPRRVLRLLAELLDGATIPGTDPVAVALAVDTDGTATRYGISIGLSEPLALVDGEVRLAVVAKHWDDEDEIGDGVVIMLASLTGDAVTFAPDVAIGGLGLRVDGGADTPLAESPVHVGAIELQATWVRDVTADAASLLALSLKGERIGIPLSAGNTESNPTAGKLLASGEGDGTESVAPTLSPRLTFTIAPDADFEITLDEGALPLWLPIQRNFGPIYLEQIGLEATDERGLILVDGGLSIDGLQVGVDDLGVSLLLDAPSDVSQWEIVLRGLAIAYDASGVSIVGGFRQIGPQYAGMVQVQVGEYGITAVGAYGEFPVGAPPDERFTSMFVFGALSAPLGGPPCFFVTGIGAGFGLNRRLALPDEVTEVIDFTLVRALDSSSGFAEDPMASLDDLIDDFPVAEGTYWLAAGVRATSFALIEEVVVLSVEFGNGLEVNVLGMARAVLPSPDLALASVELALRARFSSREMLLSVQAQLTDNSWILHESIRLTGGFAFVVWFETGDFVFTLGGYHPDFDRPPEYPDVPRLGFAWEPNSAVVVKGGVYFALTSSCVMAGGRLEAGFEAGIVWANFTAGADALLSWDPFFYWVDVYIRVSAGVRWKVCVFGVCARINLSFSIGADLSLRGPELWGRARLDLDVVSVTVEFGAPSEPDQPPPLDWATFRLKHLLQGDVDDVAMQLTVVEGLLPPDPATSSDDAETGDGSRDRPLVVAPEMVLHVGTRVPATSAALVGNDDVQSNDAVHAQFGIQPMREAVSASDFTVELVGLDGAEANEAAVEVIGRIEQVPDGVWVLVPPREERAGSDRHPGLTGLALVFDSARPGGDNLIEVGRIDTGLLVHPLPLRSEAGTRLEWLGTWHDDLLALDLQEVRWRELADRVAIDHERSVSRFAAATSRRADTRSGRARPTPRLAPLGGDLTSDTATVRPVVDRVTLPVAETPVAEVPPRRLEGLVQLTGAPVEAGPGRVTLSRDVQARVEAGEVVERVAPGLADLGFPAAMAHARLEVVDAPATGATATLDGRVLARGRARTGAAGRAMAAMDEAAADGRAELTAGGIGMWAPGSSRVVRIEGDQSTRALALDVLGRVVAEDVGTELRLDLPPATTRVVTVGMGAVDGDVPAGLAGWLEDTQVVQIDRATLLAPGCVVRFDGGPQRAHSLGVASAGSFVQGAAMVETRLPADTRSVAVLADTLDLDVDPGAVTVDVAGATRTSTVPTVAVTGTRVVTTHALAPEGTAAAVTVTVASDPRWRVVGVVASTTSPAELVADVRDGHHELLTPLVASAGGRSTVTFT